MGYTALAEKTGPAQELDLHALRKSLHRTAAEVLETSTSLLEDLESGHRQTLADLAEGIRHLGHHSLHYHFINSRLRLQLKTNDFSYWIERSLNHPWLAARLNRIDFYNDTLDELRQDILAVLEPQESSR